jgi:hypothetical protein
MWLPCDLTPEPISYHSFCPVTIQRQSATHLDSLKDMLAIHFVENKAVSSFEALAHDDAHHVFMTPPPYTSTSQGEAPPLGSGPPPCQSGGEYFFMPGLRALR